jgi:hypothetical protein
MSFAFYALLIHFKAPLLSLKRRWQLKNVTWRDRSSFRRDQSFGPNDPSNPPSIDAGRSLETARPTYINYYTFFAGIPSMVMRIAGCGMKLIRELMQLTQRLIVAHHEADGGNLSSEVLLAY